MEDNNHNTQKKFLSHSRKEHRKSDQDSIGNYDRHNKHIIIQLQHQLIMLTITHYMHAGTTPTSTDHANHNAL
jgi:hypothetical protein